MGITMRVFLLLAVLASAYAVPTGNPIRVKGEMESTDFEAFKAQFGKAYAFGQEEAHKQSFLKTVEFINKHNAEHGEGKPALAGIDWRTQGAVGPIRNQGQCGSCWAFSAVCALEGAWKINKGSLPDASEQQLVSCDPSSHGCNGGWPSRVYDYIRGQGSNGIDTESSYPYTASDSSCDTHKTSDGQNVAATCTGGSHVSASDSAHQSALSNVGPLSICVEVNSGFRNYRGGIFDDPSCGTSLNHAVALVGYDSQSYFLRNSWGTSWGAAGMMNIIIGKNTCGILNESCYPHV